jgi:hypothetical protein
MRLIAAPALVALAVLTGCASTPPAPSTTDSVAARSSAQCRTGSHICRKDDSGDKVQSVSPEVFRDSIGRPGNPIGGR